MWSINVNLRLLKAVDFVVVVVLLNVVIVALLAGHTIMIGKFTMDFFLPIKLNKNVKLRKHYL